MLLSARTSAARPRQGSTAPASARGATVYYYNYYYYHYLLYILFTVFIIFIICFYLLDLIIVFMYNSYYYDVSLHRPRPEVLLRPHLRRRPAVYVYMYVCVCIYIYIYVCMYISMYIYTLKVESYMVTTSIAGLCMTANTGNHFNVFSERPKW